MSLSVCICTRDRPGPLERALASLERLEAPRAEWEILIIDNAAADGSSRLAGRLSCSAPLRVVAEPRAGLSHARNRAMDASSAEHLIFIDDDVTVPPEWLTAYVEGFERYPQAAFWGGPIVARLESDSHSQRRAKRTFEVLKQVMPGVLGWLEPDLPEGPLPPESQVLPWGANMAFRRSALAGRTFDAARGRRPEDPLGAGEETQMFRDLLRAGFSGVWLPAARLDHHVGAERCRRRYLEAFTHGIGVMEGRRAAVEQGAEIDQVRKWASEAHRQRRWTSWRTLPWAPLKDRLQASRDLAFIEGFIIGLQAELDHRGRPENA